MTFDLLVTIKDALGVTFGGTLLLPLVIIAFLAMLTLSLRAGKTVFLIILTPVIVTVFVFGAKTAFFSGITASSMAIVAVTWLGLGAILAGIFWEIIR